MQEKTRRRAGLADFLKTRRARLRPEQFELPAFQRRRTRGLRREELAQLVGVGVSWYTWLEQGRDIQVSDQLLERLASILQLNEEERRHLFTLARGPLPLSDNAEGERPAQYATYQAILDAFNHPARLLDRRLNIVAWNEAANRVFGDYASRTERERNSTWFVFMNPSAREFLTSWESAARRCLASLRAKSDQYPDDAWLADLIADLQQSSPEFRAWWPEHDILLTCKETFDEINHPLLGRLAFHPTVFTMPEQPDLQMIVYTPLAQEDTAAKLQTLMAGEYLFDKMLP